MRFGTYGKSIAVFASLLLLSAGLFSASLKAESPDDEVGRAAIEDHCKLCHAIETVTDERHSADEWKVIVGRMIKNGAQLTAEDQATIIAYLSKTYSSQVAQKPSDGKTAQP
jgi:cytochrome c2